MIRIGRPGQTPLSSPVCPGKGAFLVRRASHEGTILGSTNVFEPWDTQRKLVQEDGLQFPHQTRILAEAEKIDQHVIGKAQAVPAGRLLPLPFHFPRQEDAIGALGAGGALDLADHAVHALPEVCTGIMAGTSMATKAMGFVPRIGPHPPGSVIQGSVLVMAIPIMSSLRAMTA